MFCPAPSDVGEVARCPPGVPDQPLAGLVLRPSQYRERNSAEDMIELYIVLCFAWTIPIERLQSGTQCRRVHAAHVLFLSCHHGAVLALLAEVQVLRLMWGRSRCVLPPSVG